MKKKFKTFCGKIETLILPSDEVSKYYFNFDIEIKSTCLRKQYFIPIFNVFQIVDIFQDSIYQEFDLNKDLNKQN